MKKAFVFDLFGTLVEVFDKHAYRKPIEDMSRALNLEYDVFYAYWNDITHDGRMVGTFDSIFENIEYILRALDLSRPEQVIQEAVDIRLEFVKAAMGLTRNDLIETLTTLKRRGYKIGLISDCSPDVPVLWPTVDFHRFFDCVIFSCEAGVKKPNPEIYKMAANGLGVRFDECYYIGDGGSQELTGAFNVGMHPILIRSVEDEKKDIHRKYADNWNGERIYSLSALKAYK